MRKYKKRKPGSKVKSRKSTGALKPKIRIIKKKVCHCAKGGSLKDTTGPTDAISILDEAIDEIEPLENLAKTDKYSDSVYNSFRKEVCSDCRNRGNCLQSKMAIVECPRFEYYYEV